MLFAVPVDVQNKNAAASLTFSDTDYQEYPLGQGGVPFPEYLAALKEVGYDGFLTIEREAGATRFQDIKNAVAFLTDILNKLY